MLSKLEELRLISQCVLADDRRAFGKLVEAYQPRLRRFLLNLTMGDVMLTDDLAQETMVKAYLGIRSFRGIASFGTWLYRIAYNEFYSERRRHEESLPDEPALEHPSTAEQDATEAQLTVRQAMQSLNDVERTAVTLFYIEGQPIKKIAAIMQRPEGSVKSSLHRAKEKMRKTINFENNYNFV